MKGLASILIIFFGLSAHSQSESTSFAEPTSQVIADIAMNWKRDTIGKSGYRLQVFKRLRHSKVDSMTRQDLFKYLGKPNHVSKYFSGLTRKNYVGYQYYVFCFNDYPKQKYFMGSFIEFVFDETETNLVEISDETIAVKQITIIELLK